eukprot:6179349-Pleurochrysis_carterae.AAC.2
MFAIQDGISTNGFCILPCSAAHANSTAHSINIDARMVGCLSRGSSSVSPAPLEEGAIALAPPARISATPPRVVFSSAARHTTSISPPAPCGETSETTRLSGPPPYRLSTAGIRSPAQGVGECGGSDDSQALLTGISLPGKTDMESPVQERPSEANSNASEDAPIRPSRYEQDVKDELGPEPRIFTVDDLPRWRRWAVQNAKLRIALTHPRRRNREGMLEMVPLTCSIEDISSSAGTM